ncbi:MAG: hypothetical protein ACYSTL_01980 [Planctomycetota bacterium]
MGARWTLAVPKGDVTPTAAEVLGALADHSYLRVRIANHHRILIFGTDEGTLRDALNDSPALKESAQPQPLIVACPGTRWCKLALGDTNGMADRIRSQLGSQLPAETTVCISGCPNGCAHSAVANIGLTGAIKDHHGTRQQVWNLWMGGAMGRTDKLAEQVARKLTDDEVLTEIAKRSG